MASARALVIGGSVGGLFAANLLRSIGWDVVVFERATGALGDRGTGIGTREELFAVMRRIGITVDATMGVAVRGRIGLDRGGAVVHERITPAVTSAWSRIWRPLRRALPDRCYRSGTSLTRVEPKAESVRAAFSDGSQAEADLLVAADGLHSTVRSQLMPGLRPGYAGYVAWRGVVEEASLPPSMQRWVFDRMVFGFPDGELFLSLPMPGPDEGPQQGARRCHFVWFRPASESVLADLCTDSSGRHHGIAIPPPLIRPELIAGIRHEADALLAPQPAALVKATGQIILQPIFDLVSPRIVFGRVALLGDAAFVARPHVATGVMKAALDAQCLADALYDTAPDIGAALARYENERRPFGQWLAERGHHIARTIVARDIDPRQRIETLMREYGAAGLVADQPITARGGG